MDKAVGVAVKRCWCMRTRQVRSDTVRAFVGPRPTWAREAPAVHDEAGRRLDGAITFQPTLRLVTVDEVGELVVVDDHQQIEIASAALHRQWLVDQVTGGIGAEQDDLQDTAAILPVRTALRQRVLESACRISTTRASSSCMAQTLQPLDRFREEPRHAADFRA